MEFAPASTVAQAAQGRSDAASVLIWVMILIAAVVILGLALLWVRRRVLAKPDTSGAPESLLSEFRKARDRGDLTPDEYEALRKKMVERIAETLGKGRDGSSGRAQQRPPRPPGPDASR